MTHFKARGGNGIVGFVVCAKWRSMSWCIYYVCGGYGLLPKKNYLSQQELMRTEASWNHGNSCYVCSDPTKQLWR